MRKIAYIILFLSFYKGTVAQNKEIDSLENILKTHKEKDTIRVNTLDHLSFMYYRQDVKKAIEYMEKADALSNEIGFIKGKGNATYMRGVIELSQSNFDLSIKYFKKAAQIFSDHDFIKNIAACYNGIGVIYFNQSDYPNALMYFEKALQADEEAGIKRNISNYITNIGNINMKMGKYPEAITNYKKALMLYREADNSMGISACLKNIASIYNKQGNYPLALDYQKQALQLSEKIRDSTGISSTLNNMSLIYKSQKNYDKALELLNKSLSIQESIKNNSIIAAVKSNMANIYIEKEGFEKAIKLLNEVVVFCRESNSKSQLSESLNNLGAVHSLLKKHKDALEYYEEAKTISEEIDNQAALSSSFLGIAKSFVIQKKYNNALPNVLKTLEISRKLELLDIQKIAHELLSEIYKNKGDYKKAFENYEQFKILSDSLLNEENIKKIAAIEYEYKYKKELDDAAAREVKLTKTVETTSKDLEKSQRNLLLGIITFLVVAMVLGSIIFFLKLRNSKAKTQNIITEQKLLRTQMTPHFIFNSLSVLQGMILNNEENKSVGYLSKFSKLLRITLENSRDKTVLLSHELEAVENYLSLQNIENEKITFQLNVDKTIEINKIKVPPMLIQPFVENAIEHAFKNQKENCIIKIKLTLVDSKLVCVILDNGMGIDSSERNSNQNKKSLATKITKERLDYLSKDFKMDASITIEDRSKYDEQGTQVTIQMPYSKTES